jgi:hypothetical protein
MILLELGMLALYTRPTSWVEYPFNISPCQRVSAQPRLV